MKFYSAIEYLCVDIANHYGLDKKLFEERIQWVKDNYTKLETLVSSADVKPLYFKAVQALRAAVAGRPVGHPVALDAVCSGLQIMSALTGCYKGALITGLVDPNVRADAYKSITDAMNTKPGISIQIPRSKAKDAVMKSLYGSSAQPKIIFGEGTPELEAFYTTMGTECEGAWTLLHELLSSWNPGALEHSWTLPDSFDVHVKVMKKVSKRIEVDELNHATFTYEFEVNQGKEKGKSNPANVIHSVDAYILRTMQRLCNYNKPLFLEILGFVKDELAFRKGGNPRTPGTTTMLQAMYDKYKIVDTSFLASLKTDDVCTLSQDVLIKLNTLLVDSLQHEPFELITVHDAFASLANNSNWVRFHYKEILADIADSEILTVILSKLYGTTGTYKKLSNNLSSYIRQSNYALG